MERQSYLSYIKAKCQQPSTSEHLKEGGATLGFETWIDEVEWGGGYGPWLMGDVEALRGHTKGEGAPLLK